MRTERDPQRPAAGRESDLHGGARPDIAVSLATAADHPAARYYDRNTTAFLRLGGGGASGSIHRQLWGAGVTSTAAAARYIDDLLGDAVGEALGNSVRAASGATSGDGRVPALGVAEPGPGQSATVIDLGCGVGGTLRALAARFPALRCCGVTISARQAGLARAANASAGLEERCEIVVADFEEVRLAASFDFAIAVESFVHSRSPQRFFATVAAHLRPGSRLILVDDFLAEAAAGADERNDTRAAALAGRFRRGWRAPAFCSVADCAAAAAVHGLELGTQRDLTPLIRLDRLRDRALAVSAPLLALPGLGDRPYLGNLLGGAALRRGLRAGLFCYRWLEFTRGRSSAGAARTPAVSRA